MHTNKDRIDWLERAYVLLRDELLPEAPVSATITFGFPSSGARGGKVSGQVCFDLLVDAEAGNSLLILNPSIFDNPLRVLDILLHEMIHLARPKAKHGKMFKELAVRCGLTGAMTSTVAGPELRDKLVEMHEALGDMPKGYGTLQKKTRAQSTRQRKYVCRNCGQIVRAATNDLKAICSDCDEPFTLTS